MERFISQLGEKVTGALEGFDRLLFRGTLLRIVNAEALRSYLQFTNVLLKDFKWWSMEATAAIREGAENLTTFRNRPKMYLSNPGLRKEDIARKVADRDKITSGPVCIITAVEPSWSFELHRDRDQRKLVLKPKYTKCLHVYHYEIDPAFGLMHTRLQTWLPFGMRVYLNGRSWLERQLLKAGIPYRKADNCFTAIADIERAQSLCNKQLKVNWTDILTRLQKRNNPALSQIFKQAPLSYYWSIDQSEWATDIMFQNTATLTPLYDQLIRHAITTFKSGDVMRFLGRRVAADGHVNTNFDGEVTGDIKRRQEGIRIKHRVKENSIKMYNKQGSVLRVETTINNPKEFKVFRPASKGGTSKSRKKYAWRTMRKGVADIERRAEVSSAANVRYLDALAAVSPKLTLKQILCASSKPAKLKDKPVRALHPFSPPDFELLETIARGEFKLRGFRNRDLQSLLYKRTPATKKEKSSRSAIITRKLRLLRAHGLISRIPKTYRYRLTSRGEALVSITTHTNIVNTQDFLKIAA